MIPATTALGAGDTRRTRTGKPATESAQEREPRASAPPARQRGFAGEGWGELCSWGRKRPERQHGKASILESLQKGCRRAVSLIPLRETHVTGSRTGRCTPAPRSRESTGRTGLGRPAPLRVHADGRAAWVSAPRSQRCPWTSPSRLSGRKELLLLGSKSRFLHPLL